MVALLTPETMAQRKAKFLIFKGADNKYYWNLKAGNGESIMTGRGYATNHGIIHNIAHVVENGICEIRFALKISSNDKPYFQLRHKSGRIIGWSELYETRQGRETGIQAVMRACQKADIIDTTD